MKILLLFLSAALYSHTLFAQDQQLVDSLTILLNNHNAQKMEKQIKSPSLYDTAAVKILNKLSASYWNSSPNKALDYANQALALSEQIDYKKGMANAYNNIGWVTGQRGDYLQALEIHKKALKIREEIGDKKGIAGSYNNIGVIYDYQGNYPEALKNYFACIKGMKEIGNEQSLAYTYTNVGGIYKSQDNFSEALKNYFAALKINKEAGDELGISDSYISIGAVYCDNIHNYPEALKYFLMALKIAEEIGNKNGIGTIYSCLGNTYENQGNYPEALMNYFASLKIKEELGDKEGIAYACIYIGKIYVIQRKYTDASNYLNRGLTLAKEIGNLEWIKYGYNSLTALDSAQGNFRQALENYKLYITYRDSLVNEENTKIITQQQMQFDFDKKQVADSLKFVQEKEIGVVKLQKQKAITYGGFAGIAITLILLFFVYSNYNKQRIANKQLKEAQEQLIKSEKMAAFGVMASRVSHEIQNPINFVTNFSELAEEMVDEIVKENNEKERMETAKDLINNLQKIKHHGKRADIIVKQLQEHTNKGTAHEYFETKQHDT